MGRRAGSGLLDMPVGRMDLDELGDGADGDGGAYCTSTTSSAELELNADDEEAFNCCLDGFDDTDELFAHGPCVRE